MSQVDDRTEIMFLVDLCLSLTFFSQHTLIGIPPIMQKPQVARAYALAHSKSDNYSPTSKLLSHQKE